MSFFKKTNLILCLVFALLAGAALSEFLLTQSNALFQHPQWVSTKSGLPMGVWCGDEFATLRPTLYGNKLNLDQYCGHNEVVFDQLISPREVSFRFRVNNQSYLIFEYNRTETTFSGFRVSDNPLFAPLLFQSNVQGQFLSKQSVRIEGWNSKSPNGTLFRAVFNEGSVSFYFDGTLVAIDQNPPLKQQKVGFRNNFAPANVSDVRIVLKDSKEVIAESFRNTRGYALTFAMALLVVALINAALAALKLTRRLWLANAAIAVAFFGLAYAFLRWPQAPLPFFDSKLPWLRFGTNLARYRPRLEFGNDVLARLRKTYSPSDHGFFRIVFLGSSQTWGAGCLKAEDAFPRRIEERLNSDPEVRAYSGVRFQCINTGISGEVAKTLVTYYADEWIKYEPKLVVVNLSNNDIDPVPFENAMERLAILNTEKRIPTLFVLEANDSESLVLNLAPNHAILRRIAEKHHIPVFDLNQYTKEHSDDGLLWWDKVHMTSFGEKLAADGLYPEILKQLAAHKSTP